VAQVSAVAAQMFQANPGLTPCQVRELLLESALPLPHAPAARTGAGLIQPALAVAAALRAPGGILAGLPRSATRPHPWPAVPVVAAGGTLAAPIYLGIHAPEAHAVSVVGDFNQWTPATHPLVPSRNGWWHGGLALPAGTWRYRFWIETEQGATWRPDPENPDRVESGYADDHTLLRVT
jgi:hypothetical protein